MAGLALADLLGRSDARAAGGDLNGGLHHRAKAKRVVQLFMSGGASHVDMFDYKPELNRRSGEKFDPGGTVELFVSNPGPAAHSYLIAFTYWVGISVASLIRRPMSVGTVLRADCVAAGPEAMSLFSVTPISW